MDGKLACNGCKAMPDQILLTGKWNQSPLPSTSKSEVSEPDKGVCGRCGVGIAVAVVDLAC